MSGPTHFHFLNVVWGEQYVETFLRAAIPNNLSPGNLPAVRCRGRSVYKIYTAPQDAERIRTSPEYARLTECIRAEVIAYDDVDFTQNKHAAMTECHRRAIRAAEEDGAAIVFLTPDAIWSDGSFARIEAIAATGKRLVAVCGGVRVEKEAFCPEVLRTHFRPEDGTLTIGSRDLVRLSLQHLHAISRQHLWDSPTFLAWCSALFWPVGADGLLSRCFHLHPLMIYPLRGVLPDGTVDADYIWRACPDPADVYVVGDSDEIFGCDMSPADQRLCEVYPNTATVESVAEFARKYANEQHHRFLSHRIRIHAGPIAADWSEAEATSDAVVTSVLHLVANPPPPAPPPPAPPPPAPVPLEPPVAAAAPAPLRRRRFLSPLYLAQKLREKGLGGCLRAGFGKIRRRLRRAMRA